MEMVDGFESTFNGRTFVGFNSSFFSILESCVIVCLTRDYLCIGALVIGLVPFIVSFACFFLSRSLSL